MICIEEFGVTQAAPLPPFIQTAYKNMPAKYVKGDEVRSHATKFDGEGERDELGLKWSERWLRDGHGEWCYGKVSFLFKKKPRMPQKYRIKYHEGTVMESLEADIERAPEDETSSDEREARPDQVELGLDDREEDGDEDERHPLDREGDEEETYLVDGNIELESDEDEDADDETVSERGGGMVHNRRKEKKNGCRWGCGRHRNGTDSACRRVSLEESTGNNRRQSKRATF